MPSVATVSQQARDLRSTLQARANAVTTYSPVGDGAWWLRVTALQEAINRANVFFSTNQRQTSAIHIRPPAARPNCWPVQAAAWDALQETLQRTSYTATSQIALAQPRLDPVDEGPMTASTADHTARNNAARRAASSAVDEVEEERETGVVDRVRDFISGGSTSTPSPTSYVEPLAPQPQEGAKQGEQSNAAWEWLIAPGEPMYRKPIVIGVAALGVAGLAYGVLNATTKE